MSTTLTLDDLDAEAVPDAQWLEDWRGFARWQIAPDVTEWFCTHCGTPVDDPSEGCELCATAEETA